MEASLHLISRQRIFLIVGIAFFMWMNIMYESRVTRLYRVDAGQHVIDLPIFKSPESNGALSERKKNLPGPSLTNIPHYDSSTSPACRPHFQVANNPMQPLEWSNFTKFKRLYFYHARKAGGTSLKYYMQKVAKHHGLEFESTEFQGSQIPGSKDEHTFYVTHLREPVARSISHFKYEGRWDCKQLTTNMTKYNPSEKNANKLEEWTGDTPCKQTKEKFFYLVKCATNCYTQWYSSLSCPSWEIPLDTQAEKAKAVLYRFNIIVILEKLNDPKYVSAVEKFFGVPGISETKSAWCEKESHQINTKFPLKVNNAALQRLTDQNRIDIELYNNISSCLSDGMYDHFPKWDGDRFESIDASRVHYTDFPAWKKADMTEQREKQLQQQRKRNKKNITKLSPACNPHFNLARSNGSWDNTTKFKRLYFYHSRKAGGSSLRYYLEKVAKHHGLEFAVTEYEMAEDPGSHKDSTFYVTNLREPVSRSISGFKYEGRWECQQLVYNFTFVPSEENARKIDTWIYTGGHDTMKCKFKSRDKPLLFFLGGCAFNCFIQWFAGKCPKDYIPWSQQYEIAEKKLLHYNIIIVLEKMKDANYIAAVENYFGVPGLTKTKASVCEPPSDEANKKNPLIMENETLEKLRELNKLDIELYESLTDCLQSGEYNFPGWNRDRFYTNSSIQVPHQNYDKWLQQKKDDDAR